MSLESQIAGLSSYTKPHIEPRTQELIRRLKEKRRLNHLKNLEDFD